MPERVNGVQAFFPAFAYRKNAGKERGLEGFVLDNDLASSLVSVIWVVGGRPIG